VNGSTVERVGMKNGKVAFRDTLTISEDGMTMTRRTRGIRRKRSGSDGDGIYSRVGEAQQGGCTRSQLVEDREFESVSDNA